MTHFQQSQSDSEDEGQAIALALENGCEIEEESEESSDSEAEDVDKVVTESIAQMLPQDWTELFGWNGISGLSIRVFRENNTRRLLIKVPVIPFHVGEDMISHGLDDDVHRMLCQDLSQVNEASARKANAGLLDLELEDIAVALFIGDELGWLIHNKPPKTIQVNLDLVQRYTLLSLHRARQLSGAGDPDSENILDLSGTIRKRAAKVSDETFPQTALSGTVNEVSKWRTQLLEPITKLKNVFHDVFYEPYPHESLRDVDDDSPTMIMVVKMDLNQDGAFELPTPVREFLMCDFKKKLPMLLEWPVDEIWVDELDGADRGDAPAIHALFSDVWAGNRRTSPVMSFAVSPGGSQTVEQIFVDDIQKILQQHIWDYGAKNKSFAKRHKELLDYLSTVPDISC